jgi:hypothetical protein
MFRLVFQIAEVLVEEEPFHCGFTFFHYLQGYFNFLGKFKLKFYTNLIYFTFNIAIVNLNIISNM